MTHERGARVDVYRCPRGGWSNTPNRVYLPEDTTRELDDVRPGGLVGRATLERPFCCVCDVEHWYAHLDGDPEGENYQVLIYRGEGGGR